MQPCDIKKDFDNILAISDSLFSYYFDKNSNSNKCVNNGTQTTWTPLSFNSKEKIYYELNNNPFLTSSQLGFSMSFWFKQFISNYGYLKAILNNIFCNF